MNFYTYPIVIIVLLFSFTQRSCSKKDVKDEPKNDVVTHNDVTMQPDSNTTEQLPEKSVDSPTEGIIKHDTENLDKEIAMEKDDLTLFAYETPDGMVGVVLDNNHVYIKTKVADDSNFIPANHMALGNKIVNKATGYHSIYKLKNGNASADQISKISQQISEDGAVEYVGICVRDKDGRLMGVTNKVLLRLKEDVTSVDNLLQKHNWRLVTHPDLPNRHFALANSPSSSNALEVASALQKSNLVRYAEPDLYMIFLQ